jgi:hypothetical protein
MSTSTSPGPGSTPAFNRHPAASPVRPARLTVARILISVVALVTAVSPALADYNETHIFNPRWPPHAKFHDAMTIQLGVLLGVLALVLVWYRRRSPSPGRVYAAAVVASLYWLSLVGANFFPNTSYVDPEFAADLPLVAGVLPPQVVLAVILLVLLVIASLLSRPRPRTLPGVRRRD